MQGKAAYRFGEDPLREDQRQAAVERAFDSVSQAALMEAGAQTGWRCWEVGAGKGSIARWLAGVVGPEGQVLATDLNDRRFDVGSSEVTFLRHDVAADPLPADRFDLVHARFLLEHLADPRLVIARLRGALRPAGVLVLEDSAGLDIEATPEEPGLDRLTPAWERAGLAVGWNASYGDSLMSDLHDAGMTDLQGHSFRRLAPGGESWAHLRHGLERLRGELIEQGIAEPELERALECLDDPGTLITGPAIVIARGRS